MINMMNRLTMSDSSVYVTLINAGDFLLRGRLFFVIGGKLHKLCTDSIYYGDSKTLDVPDGATELAFRIDAYKCGCSEMVYNGSIPEKEATCLLVYGKICKSKFVRVYCSLDGLKPIPPCFNPCF